MNWFCLKATTTTKNSHDPILFKTDMILKLNQKCPGPFLVMKFFVYVCINIVCYFVQMCIVFSSDVECFFFMCEVKFIQNWFGNDHRFYIVLVCYFFTIELCDVCVCVFVFVCVWSMWCERCCILLVYSSIIEYNVKLCRLEQL